MKILFYGTKPYDRRSFEEVNHSFDYQLEFVEASLDLTTAALSQGVEVICAFVNDSLDAPVLKKLADLGVKTVALRCAGFNNVDLSAAKDYGIAVLRVPAYSPHAVAEHTVALLLALNRKVHRAYNRVRENNFSLDGLLGFDIHGLTVGVVGTGKIGFNVARILNGFGCRVLVYDPYPNDACKAIAKYVSLDTLFSESTIISLHCPLTPDSHHLIDDSAIEKMKDGVMLLNTSRGALIDTKAVVRGLKRGKVGYLGIDVYEEEGDLFFEDLSDCVIQDDVFARLTTFPNVLITGHQAFLTREALRNIAKTTLQNIRDYDETGTCSNQVESEPD